MVHYLTRTAITECLLIPIVRAIDNSAHDIPSPCIAMIVVAFGNIAHHFRSTVAMFGAGLEINACGNGFLDRHMRSTC